MGDSPFPSYTYGDLESDDDGSAIVSDGDSGGDGETDDELGTFELEFGDTFHDARDDAHEAATSGIVLGHEDFGPHWEPFGSKNMFIAVLMRYSVALSLSQDATTRILNMIGLLGINVRYDLSPASSFCVIVIYAQMPSVHAILRFMDSIRMELANPRTMSILETYPVAPSAGGISKHAHCTKWMEQFRAPMVRLNGVDYYIGDLSSPRTDGTLMMTCKRLMRAPGVWHFVQGRSSVALPVRSLEGHLELATMWDDVHVEGKPILAGHVKSNESTHVIQTHDECARAMMSCPIRGRADGCRVLFVPIVLSCDDQSGNRSKKWNKHETWLFQLAGLLFRVRQYRYHMHFVCTSNTVDGMMMADAVMDDIRWNTDDELSEWLNGSTPGNWQDCRRETVSWITHSLQWGNHTWVTSRQTNTGIKDVTLQPLLERHFEWAADHHEPTDAETRQIVEQLGDLKLHINLFYRLSKFDGAVDFPVEILNTIPLGVVKYFARAAVGPLKDITDRKRMLANIMDNIDGVCMERKIMGDYLTSHVASAVGSEFKCIAQIGPYLLRDLLDDKMARVWETIGRMCCLVYTRRILDLDAYIVDLTRAIDDFLESIVIVNFDWLLKPKFHLLRHPPLCVRRFGPAILFAAESFEKFNSVIRQRGVNSNRMSPSRYIATSFAIDKRLRHIMSGGWYTSERGQQNMRQAGAKVTDILQRPEIQDLLGMQPVDEEQCAVGSVKGWATDVAIAATEAAASVPPWEVLLMLDAT
ncbi:hypothetical protein HK104_008416, partial [Borealophlyctis nickersoniae]